MSSHNFISLYFSLELHSLSLISLMFVITFVMVQSYRSNSLDPISYSLSIISLNLVEAALKYFWLSIILSYAILIGIATCYAFTGQTDISKVKIRIIEKFRSKTSKGNLNFDFGFWYLLFWDLLLKLLVVANFVFGFWYLLFRYLNL